MKRYNTVRISKLLILGVVFLFVAIMVKLSYVVLSPKIDGINLKKFADSRDTVKKTLKAERGAIRDRNGEILARNVNSYTVVAFLNPKRTEDKDNPKHVVDKENTAKTLSKYINMSSSSILKLLNMDSYQVELGPGGRDITELEKEKIEALNLPGIEFSESTKRYYPYGDFASYTIGYAKTNEKTSDIEGEFGIELYYDDLLSGKDGYKEYQQDMYGYQIANTPSITKKPKNGKDIYLTIDINIQMFLEETIDKIKKDGVQWATLTIADPKTGEILGTASTPSFDPNTKNITNYHDPLVSYSYEPGSTMKMYSFMVAMENGLYNGSDKYNSGKIKIDEFTIKDWNNSGWGRITYDNGFLASSNVAASNLSFKIGRNKLMDFYKKLGFGKKTGITLPNEFSGDLGFKYKTEVATAAFGQGINTTPIQNVKALTSIANDGELLNPYIVEKIVDPTNKKVIKQNKKTSLGRVYSKETAEKIKNLMYGVVNDKSQYPTGTAYAVKGYDVIGKTGTAEIANPNGGYLKGGNNYVKSFASIFPKDDPEVLMYVSVSKFGGTLAKRIKPVIENIGKYINVDTSDNSNKTEELKIKSYINKETKASIQDLKNNNLNTIVIGDGDKIINQYPKNKTIVNKNTKVFLLTNLANYTMPNMTGWSTGEITNYGNLIGLNFNYNGYGFAVSQSVPEGQKIDLSKKVDITLKSKYLK